MSASFGAGSPLSLPNDINGVLNGISAGTPQGYATAGLDAAQGYAAASGADVAALGGAGFAGAGTIGASAGLIGLAAAPALYGMSKPTVQLDSTYWGDINKQIAAGLASGATVQQKLTAAQSFQTLGSYLNGSGDQGAGGTAGADPSQIMASLQKYGITNSAQIDTMANNIRNSISAGQMPGQGAEAGKFTPAGTVYSPFANQSRAAN